MRGVHRNWTHPWQQALQGLAISSDVTHDPGGEATPRHSRQACHRRRGGDSRVTTRRKGSTHPDGHLRSDLHPTNSVSPERQRQSTKGSLRILLPRLPWLPTVLLRSEQSPEQTARRGSACPSTDLADLRYSSDRNIRRRYGSKPQLRRATRLPFGARCCPRLSCTSLLSSVNTRTSHDQPVHSSWPRRPRQRWPTQRRAN